MTQSSVTIADLQSGMLVKAVPSGITASGTPITRQIQVRLDRAPWASRTGSVVLCDDQGPIVVRADSIEIIDETDA